MYGPLETLPSSDAGAAIFRIASDGGCDSYTMPANSFDGYEVFFGSLLSPSLFIEGVEAVEP
jgi:hypothetical protein